MLPAQIMHVFYRYNNSMLAVNQFSIINKYHDVGRLTEVICSVNVHKENFIIVNIVPTYILLIHVTTFSERDLVDTQFQVSFFTTT